MNHVDRFNAHLATVGIETAAEDLLAGLTDSDATTTTVTHALIEAVEPLTRAEEQLRTCAAEIRRTLDRVEQLIDRGPSNCINGLGELQQTGYRYDMACAQLETARKAFQTMAKVYKATVGTAQPT